MVLEIYARHAHPLIVEALRETRVVFVMGARQVRKSTLTNGTDHNVVDALFAADPPQIDDAVVGRPAFVEIVAAGGYPKALAREGRRRQTWFRDYIETTLDRDLRDVSDALKLEAMPRLLRLLAAQSAGLLNYKTIADRLRLHPDTVKSYVELLETVFLVRKLPAWRPGLGGREVHAPKLHVVDSGLLAHLLAADEKRISEDDQVTGKLLESFVAMEVLKHVDWAQVDARAHQSLQRRARRDRHRAREPVRRSRGDRGQGQRHPPRPRLAGAREAAPADRRAVPRRRAHPHRPPDTPSG
jgi:hypothetical protein